MSRTGTASLPLHTGRAPRWLFERMEKLAGAISAVIIDEYGKEELVDRVSDPYWFQAFGCVLGFDWHSSGLTTTTMGALKEALDPEQHGVAVCGGKGKTSRKTPEELEAVAPCFNLSTSTTEALQRTSRMSAQVDNTLLQDTHTLYHHTFMVTEDGDWSVVQQGMNDDTARRYHWSGPVTEFTEEPQEGICAMETEQEVLDMVARCSGEARDVSVDLVNDDPRHLRRFLEPGQASLHAFTGQEELRMPDHHRLRRSDLTERSIRQLEKAYEVQPENYAELVDVEGVGRKGVRALALIAELVHGAETSWRDPAKYAYAHGGKDGTPFPVDRERYDRSIRRVRRVVERSDVDGKEQRKALRRLERFMKTNEAAENDRKP